MPFSTYTDALADQFCDLILEGKSLRESAGLMGINATTILSWADSNREFGERYARARNIADEMEFASLTDLASEPAQTVKGWVDQGWVAHRRNELDLRKWVLSKKHPTKYGDRQTVEVNMKVDIADKLEKAKARKAVANVASSG